MNELYEAIEKKIKASGYPRAISGADVYDDICDQIEGKENGEYIVEGPAIEKIMSRANLEDNESLYYFQKSIRFLGVEERLKQMGIKEGDTVKFIDWEMEWFD